MTKKARPLFGETDDVNKAFPGIKSLKVKITQDPGGFYCNSQAERESYYDKSNLPRYERCRNPRCQQGGLDLQRVILSSPNGEVRFSCGGHEGSPAGRRIGDPCENSFMVSIEVVKEVGS